MDDGNHAIAAVMEKIEELRMQRMLAYDEAIEVRKSAYKLAKSRELFKWICAGGSATSLLSLVSAYAHKNPIHLLPVIPIFTLIGYEAHLCYGNKLELIKNAASAILENYESERNLS